MKTCPTCNSQLNDEIVFCPQCGTNVNTGERPVQMQQQVDPYDHTAEFDASDISDGKVFAMLPYLLGIMGVIAAGLVRKDSKYVNFHIKQAILLIVTDMLLGIVAAVLCWTVIVPIAAGIAILVVLVLKIIAFFQVCAGKAKEVAIIRELNLFK